VKAKWPLCAAKRELANRISAKSFWQKLSRKPKQLGPVRAASIIATGTPKVRYGAPITIFYNLTWFSSSFSRLTRNAGHGGEIIPPNLLTDDDPARLFARNFPPARAASGQLGL
jgi:hypothetical protein